MNFQQILMNALQLADVSDADLIARKIPEDSDLIALLRLAELAGGQLLLQNRIRPPQSVYSLGPAFFSRHRRYTNDAQLTFPNIENDQRCEQVQLVPVTSE